MAVGHVALTRRGNSPAVSVNRWRTLWDAVAPDDGFFAATVQAHAVTATLDAAGGRMRVRNATTGATTGETLFSGLVERLGLDELQVTAGDVLEVQARPNEAGTQVLAEYANALVLEESLVPPGPAPMAFGYVSMHAGPVVVGADFDMSTLIVAGTLDLPGGVASVELEWKTPDGSNPMGGVDVGGGWFRNYVRYVDGILPEIAYFDEPELVLQVPGEHQWRFVATNSLGEATSHLYIRTVTGGDQVVITQQPEDQTAEAGQTAQFVVAAVNATSYQWQRAEPGSGTFADISGATATTYTTPTLVVGDDGAQYRCVCTGPEDAATSDAATLTIGTPTGTAPVNTSPPMLVGTPEEGQTLTVDVGTWDADPAPAFSYQWFSTGSILNNTSSHLLLPGDVGEDIYCRVTATNEHGSANADSNTVTITAANPDTARKGVYVTPTAATSHTILATDLSVAPVNGEEIVFAIGHFGPSGTSPDPIVHPTATTIDADPGVVFAPGYKLIRLTYAGEASWDFSAASNIRVGAVVLDNAVHFAAGASDSGTTPVDAGAVANEDGAVGLVFTFLNFTAGSVTDPPTGHTTLFNTGAPPVNLGMHAAELALPAAGVYDPDAATVGPSAEQGTTVAITVSPTAPAPPTGLAFDDGQPGVYGDPVARNQWWWEWDRTYFEPRHSVASAAPTRQVWVSPAGGGNGLSQGSPTTLNDYCAGVGITPTPGDQVRVMAGTHALNSGATKTVQGTAANPIRFVRDNPAVAPRITNNAASSTLGFSDSYYIGLHGLEIDGTAIGIWSLSFGRRFGADTAIRCHHVDVWHTRVHHAAQTGMTFEGTAGGGGDNKSHHLHLFASEIDNPGADPSKNFSEGLYLGSGSDTADNAHDVLIEATWIHDTVSGEGIDMKNEAPDLHVYGSRINTIRVESQGAIAAFRVADLKIGKLLVYDVAAKVGGQDGCGIWTSSVDMDEVLFWDIELPMVVSSRLQRGTHGVIVRRAVGWDCGTLGQGTLHYMSGLYSEGNDPVLDYGATVISDDGNGTNYTATNAAASDFVGPTTGSAEAVAGQAGSGFKLDAGSSIPATAGALGKE